MTYPLEKFLESGSLEQVLLLREHLATITPHLPAKAGEDHVRT